MVFKSFMFKYIVSINHTALNEHKNARTGSKRTPQYNINNNK